MLSCLYVQLTMHLRPRHNAIQLLCLLSSFSPLWIAQKNKGSMRFLCIESTVAPFVSHGLHVRKCRQLFSLDLMGKNHRNKTFTKPLCFSFVCFSRRLSKHLFIRFVYSCILKSCLITKGPKCALYYMQWHTGCKLRRNIYCAIYICSVLHALSLFIQCCSCIYILYIVISQ